MKRFLCVILMGMVLFTACSKESSATSESGTTPEATQTPEQTENSNQSQQTDEKLDAEYEAYQKKLLEKSDYMPQLEEVKSGDTIALIKTSMGDIKFKLFPEETPLTVENFVTHAKDGYYDGLLFHRVIAGFMNQTGDPLGTGQGGESIWGTPFGDEFSPYMYQFKGALAMANGGPDTNGSQFYIVNAEDSLSDYFAYVDEVIAQYSADSLLYDETGKIFRTNYSDAVREKYEEIGGTPHLDYGHTVFGQLIEGMDVVESINIVETDENDKPITDVTILSIEISVEE